jgi:acid phosphatase (class A)
MSLINRVDAIIGKKDIDKVSYLENKVSYDDELSILDIDIKTILPEPPKNSSQKTRKELELISEMTESRTRKELDLIYIVDNEPLELFENFLQAKNLPFPHITFIDYYNVLEQYIYALKYYFNRARPEQVAPYYNLDIDILYTDTHQTPSYPSGHTMYSELAAHIASEKYPEYKEDFFELSNYCGLGRILQGVHYPSDNAASRLAVSKLYPLIKDYLNEQNGANKTPTDR